MANLSSATYSGTGPGFTGQVIAQNLSNPEAVAVKGSATITGDNATATWTVNFIDGTNALPFTPTGILVQRIGGTGASTILLENVTTLTNILFTMTFSGNLTANTFPIAFYAWK